MDKIDIKNHNEKLTTSKEEEALRQRLIQIREDISFRRSNKLFGSCEQ